MGLSDELQAIETMADHGDVDGAITRAATLLPRTTGVDAARVRLLLGALSARVGQWPEALTHVDAAQRTAEAAGAVAVALEARVTTASIHAALGEYDTAIGAMGEAIRDMNGLDGVDALRRDAKAEMRGYINLVSPKNRATWASLLTR